MDRGDYAAAREAFESALALEPGRAAVEGNLALSLHEAGHPAQALPHYAVAASLAMPSPFLLANEATALFETGDLDAALATAEQALAIDATMAPAWTVVGAVAWARHEPSTAVRYLEEAAHLDPGYAPAHFYLGLAYKALDRPTAAIPAFERVLVLTSDPLARREARRHLAGLYDRYGTGVVDRRPVGGGERR
jgi:tetratricopeptide (TPR) repeat protein